MLMVLIICCIVSAYGQNQNYVTIPLTAEEYGGAGGIRRITCGVPLLAGQAKDIEELTLFQKDSAGKEVPVPVQFRPLARWWRVDNSIRWVLLDFTAYIGAGEKVVYYLTTAKFPKPEVKERISLNENETHITINTGSAIFVIPRKKFTVFSKVVVDVNGNGKLEDNENLLASDMECGTVVEDTYGQKYYGAEGTRLVEVVEKGPLRVCVRAQGTHLAPSGKGYSAGMYDYDIFMNFYAGSSEVYTDVIIANTPPESRGTPTFEDASFILKLADKVKTFALTGEEELRGELKEKESVCLYQDSNGADTWKECCGFGKMTSSGWTPISIQVTRFRGFKITRTNAEKTEEVSTGDHARGLTVVYTERGGVFLYMKNFWQQFPKAVEINADGIIRLGLFPRECAVPHFLEDTSAKGHEIILCFFPRDKQKQPDAKNLADCWDKRVYLRPPLEHISACGALADMPFTPPTQELDKKPDTRTVANGPRMFTLDKLYGNAYGWQIFGDRWRSNGGHGTRGARQPIDEDNYFYRWYVTNLPEWLASAENRSRHFRDVRCYRIDRQNPFGFKDWKEFRKANKSEDWTNRPQPTGEEYTKYTQGLWERSPWLFPNPEHCTLDLLYDRYVLLGDIRSLENMRIAAAHGGYFAGRGGTPLGGSWQWRAHGWSWRALLRYWDLTGDEEAGKCLEDVIKTQIANKDLNPLHAGDADKVNWWFTGIYCRAAGIAAFFTGDQRLIEWCKILAKGKEKHAMNVSTLFAVLYHLTGDESYKTVLTSTGKTEQLLRVTGYFPACDYWLISHPPRNIPRN
jgi:hypothetical protein